VIWLDLLQEKADHLQEIWLATQWVSQAQWMADQVVIMMFLQVLMIQQWDQQTFLQEIWPDHHQKVIWDRLQEIWPDHRQVIQWDRLQVIWPDHRQVIQWDRLQVICLRVIQWVSQDQWTVDQVVLTHYLVTQDQQVDHRQETCLQVIRWVNQDQWTVGQVVLIQWDLHPMIWVVCILIWMMQQLMDLKIQDQEHQIQWPVIWMVMV
jgi:hypothetical protein